MDVKPHITLLFIVSVLTALFLVSFTFYVALPEEQDNMNILGIELSFPKPDEIFGSGEKYADISQIILDNADISDTITEETLLEEVKLDTVRANADSLKNSVRRLEFPPNQRNLLFPVFRALDKANSQKKVVRIVHYGDSQIEGDRMTSFFRNKLQKKFGGSGVGLIPARQVYDFKYSVLHDASENWYRYTLYGKRDTLIKHKRYGILASFNSFTKQPQDTSVVDSSQKEAWITIKESPYSYSNTKSFKQCRLFYGYNPKPFGLKLYANDKLADSGLYSASNKLKQINWLFNEPSNNLEMNFTGEQSPEIYAIALDGLSGVAVDNVAMRGCAGLVFTKMDPRLFKDLVNKLNVKLMILQFGGNIVPNIRKNYDYYERWFYSQLKYIKTHAPEVQIIVIGVADMSLKKGTHYESYPNIELVRDAMKKATFRANAAYWDMFEAMGGRNSMPSWVFAKPSLAGSDFVHFNPKGARIISNMFYNAFMHEYKRYKRIESKPVSAQ
jgi:lysophospholipase L1-like esterase